MTRRTPQPPRGRWSSFGDLRLGEVRAEAASAFPEPEARFVGAGGQRQRARDAARYEGPQDPRDVVARKDQLVSAALQESADGELLVVAAPGPGLGIGEG